MEKIITGLTNPTTLAIAVAGAVLENKFHFVDKTVNTVSSVLKKGFGRSEKIERKEEHAECA